MLRYALLASLAFIATTCPILQPHALGQEAITPELLTRGEQIYTQLCASCHGTTGEGVADKYADPLTGDATVSELTSIIDETMPEGEPGKCVGPDAHAVAAYIHEKFYSEAAQVRNRPPRNALARLTANQLRQSIADLYGMGQWPPQPTTDRGVKGVYFDGARWKNENKKIDRVDPRIDFDFGHDAPGPDIQPKSFYIYWEGSVLPDQTGRYEIVVRSTCSFVMDFGKMGRKFIDNHVQSGDKTEFREAITLTAGRAYPFKIDFIQRERKTELPPAKVSLSWVTRKGSKK